MADGANNEKVPPLPFLLFFLFWPMLGCVGKWKEDGGRREEKTAVEGEEGTGKELAGRKKGGEKKRKKDRVGVKRFFLTART